ncbi:MAG TPA: class I SAM-dependent methyltransferase [Ktedonobacterales bacterium]|nr:class I SAM-dependent methyltransferase [Ktedonobacterales bacterium]
MTQTNGGAQAREQPPLGAGSVSFDRVANLYDGTRGYPEEVSAAIAEGMMRHGPLTPGATALEIGIGTGRIALPLLERGVNVTGGDISEQMTERLRAKYEAGRAARPDLPWGELTIALADSVRLPFADASFDVVIAVHVLHLITDWRRALSEALRVLRPGAPLLLGQDMSHGSQIAHPLQDEWLDIVRSLGFYPKRAGAPAFTDILAEARSRGLAVEEWTIAEWTATHTAEEGYVYVAKKIWSLTWQVPDDIFAESVRKLGVWARERYGARWTEPMEATYSFRLARVSRPDA